MSRSRLTPIGLSVLVNLALVGLMVRMLVTTPAQGERYIAVELRAVAPPVVHRSLPPVPRPIPAVHRSAFTVHRSLPTVDRSPFTIQRSLPGSSAPSLPSGGGTTASGPGAFVGPGPGNGTSGPGENTAFAPQPGPTPVPPPTTQNPQPTTLQKGESRPPSVAKQTKPVYPSDAREDGVEGVSVVLAQLDPDGKVTATRLEKSSGDRRLDRAALDAVREWTFNPCLRDGVPVKSSVRVKVEFRLE